MVKLSLLQALYGVAVTANAAIFAGLQELIPTVSTVLSAPLPDPTSMIPFQNATLATRQTSDDPYCPEGLICDLERCSSECPEGQYCLAVGENAYYCISEAVTFCRFDPTTRTAWGCSRSGVECCHGNCLNPGKECCDFFDASCDLTQQDCGQCAVGSCGASGCLSSSSTTTTTTTTTTTSSSSSETTSITKSASTTKSTSTSNTTSSSTSSSTSTITSTTTSTTTSNITSTTTGTTTSITTSTLSTTVPSTTATTSTSTTTTTPTTPTIIPGVGTFVYRSCLVDIWDARVLVADSDDSQSMSVQRCVEVAQAGYWRYAGVEFGTQCYVGNTLHGPDQFPDSDCSQACAGDGTQACGEAGRIQVYEDLTWKNPTIDELAAAVERYNATMEDARAVIASYQGHVNELEELLQSQSSRKRQAQQLEELEMKVRKDYSDVEAVRAREESDREAGNEALTHSLQRDTLGTANTPAPLPEDLFEEWGITGENLSRYLGQIRTRISGWLDEFQRAQQAGSSPQIDTAAAAAEVEVALQAIGTAFTVALTTGFFLVLDSIVSFFKGLFSGGGDGGGEEQTSTTTTTGPTKTTSTTTTTTSTCTATATTTPVAIFAASGASTDDFNALIDTLPDDPGSLTLIESWMPNYLYTGYVDGCSLEKLAKDPIVSSWLITQGSQAIWQFDCEGSLSCTFSST